MEHFWKNLAEQFKSNGKKSFLAYPKITSLSETIKITAIEPVELTLPWRTPAREHLDIMALKGQGLIFKQKNISLTNTFNRLGNAIFLTEEENSLQYESMRQILQMAQIKNLNIVLFINPYHSDYLTIIRLAGMWDQFLLWKRQLTRLADEFNTPL